MCKDNVRQVTQEGYKDGENQIFRIFIMIDMRRQQFRGESSTGDMTGLRRVHDRRYHSDLVFIDDDSLTIIDDFFWSYEANGYEVTEIIFAELS